MRSLALSLAFLATLMFLAGDASTAPYPGGPGMKKGQRGGGPGMGPGPGQGPGMKRGAGQGPGMKRGAGQRPGIKRGAGQGPGMKKRQQGAGPGQIRCGTTGCFEIPRGCRGEMRKVGTGSSVVMHCNEHRPQSDTPRY